MNSRRLDSLCVRARTFALAWLAAALVACGVGQDGTGAAPVVQATGVVTGFGSVLVDGERYDIAGADIVTDGVPGRSQADLRVGMVVTVTATRDGEAGGGTASKVVYESLLTGALDDAPGADGLRVLGQRVRLDETTVIDGVSSLADLRPADALQISGFIDPAGGFRATWIRREATGVPRQITGFVAGVDGLTVRVAGLSVDTSGATLVGLTRATLGVGQRVRVVLRAAPSGNAAVATRVVRIDTAPPGADVQVSLQGLVAQWDPAAQSFLVDRQRVRLQVDTSVQGGSVGDIGIGARVGVLGFRGADGVLAAEQVFVYRPAIDGYLRGRVIDVDRAQRSLRVEVAPQLIVELLPRTVLSDRTAAGNLSLATLSPGDEVLVLGWLGADRIEAGLVQRLSAALPGAGIGGPVTEADAAAARLGVLGVAVGARTAQFFAADGTPRTRAEFFAGLAVGDVVRAEGVLLGGGLVAATVRRVR